MIVSSRYSEGIRNRVGLREVLSLDAIIIPTRVLYSGRSFRAGSRRNVNKGVQDVISVEYDGRRPVGGFEGVTGSEASERVKPDFLSKRTR